MEKRPDLKIGLEPDVFIEYYYLKEELQNFCREVGLSTSGGKIDITKRIERFLRTGEKIFNEEKSIRCERKGDISLTTRIEKNIVCSEKHRTFFKNQIGPSFKFNVGFQKWLKENYGKTYQEAIEAYYDILEKKKSEGTQIDKQFEYNTYIRDFFNSNKDKDLHSAIKCWKYKKSLPGHNKYEKEDLVALDNYKNIE